MLERYTLEPMDVLFTDVAAWQAVLDVELAAVKARARLGQVSDHDLAEILDRVPFVNGSIVSEIKQREAVTDHDVAAFVDVIQTHINHPAARELHYGLTSADVTDTALCLRLSRALKAIISAGEALLRQLCNSARQYMNTPTAGRTHGQHAEVITFGVRLANWAEMVERAVISLREARKEISVGKLSGACGTYSNIDPRVEALVCHELGLKPITATQIIPRDLHAHVVYACVRLGNAIGHISFNLRIMASTEYGEVEEGRRAGQKGSSAMPHKRNPIKSEQFDGLARTLRGYLGSTLENVELLFERDISHSAPERIVLADALTLTHYMAVKQREVLSRLVVKPDRMQLNIDRGLGLMYTQTLLTAMLDAGWQRDAAYRVVQDLAFAAKDSNQQLRELVEQSEALDFTDKELDHIFDQNRLLSEVDRIIARLPIAE